MRDLLSRLIKGKTHNNQGSYGKYFKISKNRGIKLYYERFKSKKEALNNFELENVIKECNLLKKANKLFPRTPKCYGIRIVKDNNYYRVGILMQHLEGPVLGDCYWENKAKIHDDLYEELKQSGIIHGDLNYNNIIFHKEEWYAIDFTPHLITTKPKQEELISF